MIISLIQIVNLHFLSLQVNNKITSTKKGVMKYHEPLYKWS